ncbi:MAG: OOP family OmpA-OmpF porin [Candidatus Azotimanducaceae bacterium]
MQHAPLLSAEGIAMRFIMLTLLVLANYCQAEEQKGLTLFPHLGQTNFSGDSDLETDNHVGLGVGYRFDSPWGIEFTYQTMETDFDNAALGDADIDLWRLDGLYHFKTENDVNPFLSFGYGRSDYDLELISDEGENQINIGAGVKWFFSEKAALRGDFKLYEGNREETVESAISLGLHFALGGSKRAGKISEPAQPVDGDADGDGVLDSIDRCPGTPASVAVNSRGCPRDDDGDGVYNYEDSCLDTTNRRAQIDASGCYEKLTRRVHITLKVEFDFDSSQQRDEHAVEVERVADFMVQFPDSKVVMEGHTDSKGEPIYNQGLSERRAKTIADMLVDKFSVNGSRVSSKGRGETKPVATNDTAEGRQQNRRVVGVVEGQKHEIKLK